jgi:hypothetical protein
MSLELCDYLFHLGLVLFIWTMWLLALLLGYLFIRKDILHK